MSENIYSPQRVNSQDKVQPTVNALSISTVAGLEHLAVEDIQGKQGQAVAGEDMPGLDQDNLVVPAVEGSPEEVAGDSPEGAVGGSPVEGPGSTAAGDIPVLGEVADIHMGYSPLA